MARNPQKQTLYAVGSRFVRCGAMSQSFVVLVGFAFVFLFLFFLMRAGLLVLDVCFKFGRALFQL